MRKEDVDCGEMFGRVNQCLKWDSTSSANIRYTVVSMCSCSQRLRVQHPYDHVSRTNFTEFYLTHSLLIIFLFTQSQHPSNSTLSLQIITNNHVCIVAIFSNFLPLPKPCSLTSTSKKHPLCINLINKYVHFKMVPFNYVCRLLYPQSIYITLKSWCCNWYTLSNRKPTFVSLVCVHSANFRIY